MSPLPPPYPLDDDALLAAFLTTTISAKDFHHREHVRVVWKLIATSGPEEARERFVEALLRLAKAHGADQLYHETLTRAWVELIAQAARTSPDAASADEFLDRHPELLDRSILHRFYSPEVLASDEARRSWLMPDRLPLGPAGQDSNRSAGV